ncbi:MAG: ABC transporter ATP-binding protein [Candidatus Hydrogenedentes bacterium]|nr:ABC transporter ATP-binding protein [Candidatus Hydrogenedentota bacterium]
MAYIEVENLTVTYGDFVAIDNISFSLEPGVIGLIGPNGAGKTTLIRTFLGFLRPQKGKILIGSFRIPKDILAVRTMVGHMPEKEVISPKVSGVNFLVYCGRLVGMSYVDALERAHEVLNYVGLQEARYRPMQTYSTGMLQRLKLAQAILHDPRLLILDEPTNGLDPDGRLEMLDLIREIAEQRGVTTILSTHLLPDVQSLCNQVVVLKKGIVEYCGSLKELIESRVNQYEISVQEPYDGFLSILKNFDIQYEILPQGKISIYIPDSVDHKKIFECARASGTIIRSFSPASGSLSELFQDSLQI